MDDGSNVDDGSEAGTHVRRVDIWPLGDSIALDVSAFFEGSARVFSVSSSAPDVVDATLVGNVLTLVAVSAGRAVVSVVASEGGRRVVRTLLVEAAEDCPGYVCRTWTDGWRLQVLMDSR